MYQSKTPITVQYYETDKMGVVHHSNYIRYFETARSQFLEEIDVGYAGCEERGLFSPVLSVKCNYKKSCTYMDELIVLCNLKELRKLRLVVEYKVMKGEVEIAGGETEHIFVDENMKPINIIRDYPEMVKKLQKALD